MGQKNKNSLNYIFANLLFTRIILPILIISLFVIGVTGYIRSSNVSNQQMQLTQTVAFTVDNYLQYASHTIETIALMAETATPAEFNKFMDAVWRGSAYFDTLYRLDSKGNLTQIVPPVRQYLGANIASQLDMDSIDQLKDGLWISPPVKSTRTGLLTALVVKRMVNEEMIVGELNLDTLQRVITAGFSVSDPSLLFVIDRKGNFLAHPQRKLAGKQVTPDDLSVILKVLNADAPGYYFLHSRLDLINAAQVSSSGWIVVEQTPFKAIYSPILLSEALITLLIMVIFSLIFYVFSRYLKRFVFDPIIQLRRSADALSSGDYIESEKLISNRPAVFEISVLLDAFQNMSRTILTREIDLRESEEKNRALFDAIRDPILVFDYDTHRITDVNDAAVQVYGFSREQLIGMQVDDVSVEPCLTTEAIKDGQEHISMCFHKKADGNVFPVDITTRVFSLQGRKTIISSVRDITERLRVEQQLRNYATELEKSNEEIKRFTYLISHDLRAPLANLKGFADELRLSINDLQPVIEEGLSRLNQGEQQAVRDIKDKDIPEALSFIENAVTRIDHFIAALLKLARLGYRELKLESIDMNEMVQMTLMTLAHQINERQVKVSVGALPEVNADRLAVEQVLENLLHNAVKYLDPERPGEIEISAEVKQDVDWAEEAVFCVRDNGRGIAESSRDQIFEPFVRSGDNSIPGEGMGLAYTQMLVRRHGGKIWFESVAGMGTAFFFTLPMNKKSVAN
jgi:PAS domain S-box-containing protein